jgi:hypothetical protein
MEATFQTPQITDIRLLGKTVAPHMRRLYIYVEPEIYDDALAIARSEGMDISEAVRELLRFSLTYHQKTKEIAQTQGMDILTTIGELAAFALTFYQKTKEIAQQEGLDIATTTGELYAYAVRYHSFRRGTLNEERNEALPEKSKTFHCQICRTETNIRRRHKVQVLNEEYFCCEDCFFADKHKGLVITLMNRA